MRAVISVSSPLAAAQHVSISYRVTQAGDQCLASYLVINNSYQFTSLKSNTVTLMIIAYKSNDLLGKVTFSC